MAAMDSDPVPPPPDASPGSPFRPEPEPPRLGILHLLVWTACVAVYFSLTHAVYSRQMVQAAQLDLDSMGFGVGLWVMEGIVSGTALGGLLLLASRRYQRLRFPRQPGETLWALLGIAAVMELLSSWLWYLAAGEPGSNVHAGLWVSLDGGFRFLTIVVLSVLYLFAAARTKTGRWRLYLITVAAANVVVFFLPCMGVILFSVRWALVFSLGPQLIPLVVLLGVALKDFLTGDRYGWTHWSGVGIALCNGVILATQLVWWILAYPPSP